MSKDCQQSTATPDRTNELVTAQSLAAKHDGTDTETEYRSLNADQKRIVDKVFSSVCNEQIQFALSSAVKGAREKAR